jgi:hypothetical protein
VRSSPGYTNLRGIAVMVCLCQRLRSGCVPRRRPSLRRARRCRPTEDVLQMPTYGVITDDQCGGDLLVRLARRYQGEHLKLAGRQTRGSIGGCLAREFRHPGEVGGRSKLLEG